MTLQKMIQIGTTDVFTDAFNSYEPIRLDYQPQKFLVRIDKDFDLSAEKIYIAGVATFSGAKKETDLVEDYRLFWSESCAYETRLRDLEPATEFGDILRFSSDRNGIPYERYFTKREVPFGSLFFHPCEL